MTEKHVRSTLTLNRSNWSEHRDEVNQAIDYFHPNELADLEVPYVLMRIGVLDSSRHLAKHMPWGVKQVVIVYQPSGVECYAEPNWKGSAVMWFSCAAGLVTSPFYYVFTILCGIKTTATIMGWLFKTLGKR